MLSENTKEKVYFRILLIFIFTIIFIIIIGYIDYELLTPLLPIPEDICFYHQNNPPVWIKLFYLDYSEHTEPPYSNLHILTLFAISLTFGIITAKKLNKFLLKRD